MKKKIEILSFPKVITLLFHKIKESPKGSKGFPNFITFFCKKQIRVLKQRRFRKPGFSIEHNLIIGNFLNCVKAIFIFLTKLGIANYIERLSTFCCFDLTYDNRFGGKV